MVVCAHGNVEKFCEYHNMQILESYRGNLDDYKGNCPVIVTDQMMSRVEYDALKCRMFARGFELVSVTWTDDEVILRLLQQTVERRKKRGGRQMFGFYKNNGVITENPAQIAVARRVIELRDAGYTLAQIQADAGVHHGDGRKLAVSTIQVIVKNRSRYESD